MRPHCLGLAAALLALTAGPARAQVAGTPAAHGPRVNWHPPPSNAQRCPREDVVRDWIAAYFLQSSAGADVTADLSVMMLAGGWKLELTLTGPRGKHERTFLSSTCKQVVAEAAEEIAVVVLPGGPTSEGPAPTAPTATTTTTTTTGQPVRSHWGLLQVTSGVSLGIIRTAMALLRLGIGYRAPRWSVAVTNTFLLPRDVLSGAEPAIYVNLWQWVAGVRGCWIPKLGRVEVGACATVEGGIVSGRQVDGAREHHVKPWLGLSLGPSASIRLSKRVRLQLGIDIIGIPLRPIFTFQGRQDVCCDEKFGGRAFAGVELLLP